MSGELSDDGWGMTETQEAETREQKVEGKEKDGGMLSDLFSQFISKEPEYNEIKQPEP